MESFKATSNTRRPCFIEEDNGLASLAKMKIKNGFSSNNNNNNYPLISRPIYNTSLQRKSNSFRNLVNLHGVSSPRIHFDADQNQQPHFLDACFLCNKPLCDKDIFMYRGDTPFCSEECREEQIEMDEAKEKSWNLSSMKALREKDQRKSSTSSNKSTPFRTGAVAAA